MTPERWRRVNAMFHAAVALDTAARDEFLTHSAADDPTLADDVRSLIAAHEESATFLEEPAWAVEPELALGAVSLPPPHTIGPYRIVRELGRGGMGIVYEAEDTRLRRLVALKALPAEYSSDPVRRERLVREARAAAALAHPAIATVYALEEFDGAVYLASELVRGRTLREELAAGALPVGQLGPTLHQLASGLAAAHAANIVHRDFKPENVIRCADGRVKIVDFGLATQPLQEDRLTRSGTAIGTPGYMPPEQLRGSLVDATADVFAFGVVAWELATGRHPWGASAAEMLARMTDILDGTAAAAMGSTLPLEGLDRIIRRCLRRDPAERYRSAGAVLRDLEALPSGTAAAKAAHEAPGGGSLWWWQFHQAALACVLAAMPVAEWFVRGWDRRLGARLFLAVLALSTVAVTIRLNLLFTSRISASQLPLQRRRVVRWLVGVEGCLGLVVLISGGLVAGSNDVLASVLVTLAVATLASLVVIEPATTGAAGLNRAPAGRSE